MEDLKYFLCENDYKNLDIEYPNVSYTEDTNNVWVKEKKAIMRITYQAFETYNTGYVPGLYDATSINSEGLALFEIPSEYYSYSSPVENFSNIDNIKLDGNVISIDELDSFYQYSRQGSASNLLHYKGIKNLVDNSIHILEITFNDVLMFNIDSYNYDGFFNLYNTPYVTSIEVINFKEINLYNIFSENNALKEIYLDSNVKKIYKGGINCEILIDENNKNYYYDNGCIIEKSTKTLIDANEGFNGVLNDINYISDYAFYGCDFLTKITIPSSIKTIGVYAFSSCVNLTEVNFEDNCQITILNDDVFSRCGNLKSIVIPNSITEMNSSVFSNCHKLHNVVIPNSVTSIDNYAFNNCYFTKDNFINNSSLNAEEYGYWGAEIVDIITEDGLIITNNEIIDSYRYVESITIPNYVTKISSLNSYNLTSIDFEENSQLKTINNYAITSNKLTSLTIPSSVTSIGKYAFYTCLIQKDNFINKSSLDAEANNYWGTIIYDTFTEDGLYIKGTTIVKEKDGITDITIPNGITSIGENVFDYCYNLTSITIPNSVSSIGYGSVNGSKKLSSITCYATTAPTLGSYALKQLSLTGTLRVPQGSNYSTWKSVLGSGWTIEYI